MSRIAEAYARRILREQNPITIDDVPERIREEVRRLVESMKSDDML